MACRHAPRSYGRGGRPRIGTPPVRTPLPVGCDDVARGRRVGDHRRRDRASITSGTSAGSADAAHAPGRGARPGGSAGAPVRVAGGTARAVRASGRRRRAARRRGSRPPRSGSGRSPTGTASSSPHAGPSTDPIVHGPTPGTSDSSSGDVVVREVGPPPQLVGEAGHGDERAGPLHLDAERVEPPGGHRCQALGGGRQQQTGERSRGRLAQLAHQRVPLAHGLAAGDALADDRGQQGVVEVAAAPGGEPRVPPRRVVDERMTRRRRVQRAVDRRHRPTRRHGRARRPDPRRRSPSRRRSSRR